MIGPVEAGLPGVMGGKCPRMVIGARLWHDSWIGDDNDRPRRNHECRTRWKSRGSGPGRDRGSVRDHRGGRTENRRSRVGCGDDVRSSQQNANAADCGPNRNSQRTHDKTFRKGARTLCPAARCRSSSQAECQSSKTGSEKGWICSKRRLRQEIQRRRGVTCDLVGRVQSPVERQLAMTVSCGIDTGR